MPAMPVAFTDAAVFFIAALSAIAASSKFVYMQAQRRA